MNLFIKTFPEDLHRELKIMAVNQGKKLYLLIIELLRKAVKNER